MSYRTVLIRQGYGNRLQVKQYNSRNVKSDENPLSPHFEDKLMQCIIKVKTLQQKRFSLPIIFNILQTIVLG